MLRDTRCLCVCKQISLFADKVMIYDLSVTMFALAVAQQPKTGKSSQIPTRLLKRETFIYDLASIWILVVTACTLDFHINCKTLFTDFLVKLIELLQS